MAYLRRWKLSLKTNHLYFRILGYFLFLLIPTCVVGAVVYYANISIYKQQLADKLTSNLAASSQVIDIYLRTAEQTAMNFFINDTVQAYMSPYDIQTPDAHEKATSIIKVLASSRNIISPYIDDLFVYADRKWVYKSEGMEDFHSFFNDFYVYEGYNDSYWGQLLKADYSFRVLKPTTVSKRFVARSETVVPVVTTQYIRGNQVVMVVTISASKIMDTLTNGAIVDATRFAVTDNEGNLIVADPLIGASVSLPELADALQGSSGHGDIRIDNVDYLVNLHQSEYGWSYYALTPAHVYKDQATGILSVTVWLALVLILIGVVFSFIFSTKLYNPIRNLLQAYHEREQFSGELLENAFLNLLNGASSDKYKAFMEEIGFAEGEYVCVCIKFNFKEAFYHEIQDVERLTILERLKKIILGVLHHQVDTYVIEIQNQFYAAMINLKKEEDRKELDKCLRSLLSTFEYDTKYCRLTIGVGRTYAAAADLADSFGDARIALAKADPKQDFQIIDCSDYPVEESFHFNFADENKVINGLRAGDKDVLNAIVQSTVRVNLEKDTSHNYMNLLLIELYNIGIKYAIERGITPARLLREDDHRILSGKSNFTMDLNDQTELLIRFYEAIMERATSPEDNKAGQLVSRMMSYIDENFAQDLYLERIAAEMNLSAKYVSKVFKEITGTNMTDYISMKRIGEAKQLLATTQLKNDEIAERVGIVSRATFFRLFKKYEGVTPQEYRAMLMREQRDS